MADEQIVSWNRRVIGVFTSGVTSPLYYSGGTGISLLVAGSDYPGIIIPPSSTNIQVTTGSNVPGFISTTFTITAAVTNYGLVGGNPVPGVEYGSRLRFTGPGTPTPSFYYFRNISTRGYVTFNGSALDQNHTPPTPGAACRWLNGEQSHDIYGPANKPQEEANYWVDVVFVSPSPGWTFRSSVRKATSLMPLTPGLCGAPDRGNDDRSSPIYMGFSLGVPAGDKISKLPKKVVDPTPITGATGATGGGTLGGVAIGGVGGSDDTIVPSTPDTIALSVTPDPISFADTIVGNYLTQTFVIKNHSGIPVTITNIFANSILPVADQAFAVGVEFPFTLEPNATKLATMYFTPKTTTAYQDIFTIEVEDPADEDERLQALDFSVDGTGIAGPEPEVPIVKTISLQGDVATSGDIDFLDVTVNGTIELPYKDRELKIINSGSQVPLRIESLNITGDAGQFSVIQGAIPVEGISLGVGLTWTVKIRFQPTSIGDKSGIVTVKSDADTGDVDEFGFSFADLDGRGVAQEPLLKKLEYRSNADTANTNIDFGTENKLNITSIKQFRIKNIGNTRVEIVGLRVTYFPPQTQPPFVLGLSALGGGTGPNANGVWSLTNKLILEPEQESLDVDLAFTPVTVTEFSGIVEAVLPSGEFLNQSPTPAQPFSGKGKLDTITPEEPEQPSGPIEPETPPDEVFDGVPPDDDPGETPGDGYSSACVSRTCAIPYLYKYTVNQTQPTQ